MPTLAKDADGVAVRVGVVVRGGVRVLEPVDERERLGDLVREWLGVRVWLLLSVPV